MPRYHSMLKLDPILPPNIRKYMTKISEASEFQLQTLLFIVLHLLPKSGQKNWSLLYLVWSGHLAPNNSKISDDLQRMRLPWIAWCSSVGWGNGPALAVENPLPFEIWEALAEAPLDLELCDQGFGVGQGAAGASSALTHNYFQGIHVHNL